MFSSCIGSFALTNKVLNWNNQVGDKFVNEIVFFAFHILPVYELTILADVLVLNSIEFWSGNNPAQASTKVIQGKDAPYRIDRDQTGYTITNLNDNSKVRLNHDANDDSWSVVNKNGESVKIFSYADENHVNVIAPDGSYKTVALSEQGVMAYEHTVLSSTQYALR